MKRQKYILLPSDHHLSHWKLAQLRLEEKKKKKKKLHRRFKLVPNIMRFFYLERRTVLLFACLRPFLSLAWFLLASLNLSINEPPELLLTGGVVGCPIHEKRRRGVTLWDTGTVVPGKDNRSSTLGVVSKPCLLALYCERQPCASDSL